MPSEFSIAVPDEQSTISILTDQKAVTVYFPNPTLQEVLPSTAYSYAFHFLYFSYSISNFLFHSQSSPVCSFYMTAITLSEQIKFNKGVFAHNIYCQ